MACYHPNSVLIYKDIKTKMKGIVKFSSKFNFQDLNCLKSNIGDTRKMDDRDTGDKEWYICSDAVLVPCGKCVGCAVDISRDWSYRLLMEKEISKNAWFLTLTYDEQHLPKNHQLEKEVLNDFIKKLRNYYYDFGLDNIRYYACGEYGSKSGRPHYHMIVYNLPLTPLEFKEFGVKAPKEAWKYKTVGSSIDKSPLYQFDLLNNIWKNGYVVVGNVTIESCGYVARYVNKKRMSGVKNEELKKNGIVPEFNCMSRMPGLAVHYYEKYWKKILDNNLTFFAGATRLSVGRSFEKWLLKYHADEFDRYKALKEKKALYGKIYNQDLLRRYGDINIGLEHDEEIKQSSYNTLKRNL